MKHNTSVFKFQPFSLKQKKVLTWWLPESPVHDRDIIITDGSVRSGKTIANIDGFIMWSQYTFEHQNFILAGKSMGALKRNVLRPLFQILNAKGFKYNYNRSENYIEIGTNTYFCFGANNEASQDVLQGLTAAGGLADEVALFPESFVEQMIARCSVEGSKLWWNCNPEGPRHYIKTEYIDQAAEKNILRLHFTLDDNLTLSPKIKERYKRLFTGLWRKRMIDGLWVMAEGAVYDMFDEDKHIIRDPEQQKEIINNAKQWYVSNDYGTGTVFVLGLFCVYQGKRYLVRSYYWDAKKQGRQKSDGEYVEDLKRFIGDRIRPRFIIIPDDALSFIAECRRKGVGPLHIYRREPGTVLRGIRTQGNMLAEGRYFIFDVPENQEIIAEYSEYVWDPKAQERGEDAPLKQNDHGKDMERYFHDTLTRNAYTVGQKPIGF